MDNRNKYLKSKFVLCLKSQLYIKNYVVIILSRNKLSKSQESYIHANNDK